MRVAVIVVTMLVATTPSLASQSCMSQAEARQHFPSDHIYWHGPDHCWDATAKGHHQIHQVQQQIDPPKINQSKWRNSMSAMLPDDNPAQSLKPRRDIRHDGNDAGTSWGDRWVEFEQSPLVARWVDIAQVGPPPIVERKAEPWITLRGAVLVFIAIAFVLTLASIEVLFRGTIYERPRSRGDTGSES
jgi:hypothetical protein